MSENLSRLNNFEITVRAIFLAVCVIVGSVQLAMLGIFAAVLYQTIKGLFRTSPHGHAGDVGLILALVVLAVLWFRLAKRP